MASLPFSHVQPCCRHEAATPQYGKATRCTGCLNLCVLKLQRAEGECECARSPRRMMSSCARRCRLPASGTFSTVAAKCALPSAHSNALASPELRVGTKAGALWEVPPPVVRSRGVLPLQTLPPALQRSSGCMSRLDSNVWSTRGTLCLCRVALSPAVRDVSLMDSLGAMGSLSQCDRVHCTAWPGGPDRAHA